MEACESLYESPPLRKKTCKKLRIENWYMEWSRELQFETSDPLLLLSEIRGKLEDELEGEDNEDEVLEELDKVIQTFQDDLMDHFDV
jgi:hypothetical protein